MPVLIQDFATGNFATANGRWTKQLRKAMQFSQVLRAWEEIDERRLSGVRIVLQPEEANAPTFLAAFQCPTATA